MSRLQHFRDGQVTVFSSDLQRGATTLCRLFVRTSFKQKLRGSQLPVCRRPNEKGGAVWKQHSVENPGLASWEDFEVRCRDSRDSEAVFTPTCTGHGAHPVPCTPHSPAGMGPSQWNLERANFW